MKRNLHRFINTMFVVLAFSIAALAQGTTSQIAGSIQDPNGAVISGASVTVKNVGTGAEFKVTSSGSGAYSVPSLGSGVYTVSIEATGFKKAVVQDVKLDVGVPATVNVTMEVGAASESVIVQGGAEVLQTQSANVSTTITGRQITETPLTSRDALDLVLLLPGTNTPGRPRTSTINGLPKGSLNITMDGVNVQDNILKSSDGFFTYVRPRLDAVDEVTVSTATPGAESAGEGAVQIKFVTRGGTNEYTGSLYEYHRNPWLNANYWFNNRDSAPKPGFNTAPRDVIILNQFGGRLGGPIRIPKIFDGRDKAFFFVNYEEYRIPEQTTRQRTILSEAARSGVFRYGTNTTGVNLYTLAAANGHTSTPDPTIAKLLQDIRNSTTSTGAVQSLTDPNLERFTFTNQGGQTRYFPTVRLDFNLTEKHKLENVWNYQLFTGLVDFLNSTDPTFPNFPNQGYQGSNRFSNTTALRSTLTPTIVNEARFGLTGGTVLFFPNVNVGQFTGSLANQDGFSIGIGAAGITSATVSTTPSRRNAPVKTFTDTLTWTRGSHSMSFGGSFTNIDFWSWSQQQVPTITLGVDTTDPANALFNTTNFPGASATDLTNARNIYATLTGRVTAVNASALLNENTLEYTYLGANVQRGRQREFGFFAQDAWRVNPNLTLTGGVRWEVQLPFQAKTSVYSQTTFNELFGISGPGNLFKPGTQTGKVTEFTQFSPGTNTYNVDYNNFAPSLGLAWTPRPNNGLLKKVFGDGGQTVFRGGYSIAFVREGLNVFTSILASNPGLSIVANKNLTLGNLGTLPVLFRDKSRLAPPHIPNQTNLSESGSDH